jgi:hypothetical protein
MTAPVGETLRRKIAQREDVSPHCNAIVNDQRIVDRLISWAHGNPDNADIYLPLAQQGLDPGWFTLHHTRSTLALLCVFLTKYTERDTPGKEFRNTKLDADYLALLHYADGLATNETSGIMADMCSWLYGDTKTVFATAQLDEVLPSEDETRLAAYLDWRGGGMKNGRDVEDWLGAEKRLLADVWNRLRGQRES